MSSTIAAPSTADLAEWAAHYARSGFEIFPLNADKSPATAHGFLDATSDVDTVAGWWEKMPTALIGCRIPEGVVVLDVDPRHGGVETMKQHVDRHGRLPRGRQHFSGRGDGGGHRWFTRPAGKLTTKHLPGVDLLHHDLRYSILPPSPHPETGKPYEWSADGGAETAPAEMPGWLADLIVDDRPEVGPKPALERLPGDNLHRTSIESPIERFKAEHKIEDLLARHGWIEVRAGAWCHPTATSNQSATITDGRLYVYSSTPGLPVTEHGDPQGLDVFDLFRYLEHGGDLDAAIRAASEPPAQPRRQAVDPVTGEIPETTPAHIPTLDELLDEPEEPYDWLVPGLLERGDRVILTAAEGVGKSTLLRQIALMVAAGKHPFSGEDLPAPVPALIVDLENGRRHVKRQLVSLRQLAGRDLPLWVEIRPAGIDLTTQADRYALEAVIASTRPALVVIGPTYKMAAGDPTEEKTAKAVAFEIDRLRVAYGFAVLLEAHQPYGTQGSKRPERPYGASLWSRWPEFGINLQATSYRLTRWRGDRDIRSWPEALRRGFDGEWPFMVADGGDASFARMMAAQLESPGKRLTNREIGEIVGCHHTTVGRAVRNNRKRWAAMLSQLGLAAGGEEPYDDL